MINDKDDIFMSGDNGESWVGGPRPHGEWIENLTAEDIDDHGTDQIVMLPEYVENYLIDKGEYPEQTSVEVLNGCVMRFIKTFGEHE